MGGYWSRRLFNAACFLGFSAMLDLSMCGCQAARYYSSIKSSFGTYSNLLHVVGGADILPVLGDLNNTIS